MDKKIELMRKLMVVEAHYNRTFCYGKHWMDIDDSFKHDFPIAYSKIMQGEINISRIDMGLN